jgi:polar amino acid transport system substrate-binding protein
MLDKWVRTGTAKLGVNLLGGAGGFPDPATGQLSGFSPDLDRLLFKDVGNVTIDFVQLQFDSLFPALASGQVDMLGHGVTILPSRSLKSLFAGFPVQYESNVLWLAPGESANTLNDLDKSGKKLAVLAGSSQQYSAPLILPNVQILTFGSLDNAVSAVATSRADAVMIAPHDQLQYFTKYPALRTLPGPPLFVDDNSYLMPAGDEKLWQFVTNWLRYQATHGNLTGLYLKWYGAEAKKTPNLPPNYQLTGVDAAGGPQTISVF